MSEKLPMIDVQVTAWLQSEGYSSEWVESFKQNEMDGQALVLLKDDVSVRYNEA